ncbi:hypothetical protein VPNG_01126 [Cytospora leucostoma]|uniref:ER membrane protein complex subunit 10 n=1 Tax=Cytospora leucostoma TaxID=1230097 RepID=A0A423XLY4_9PEZI|nr:hypothetical protein VPNG_01126 [Cytospora leucostoma]
MRAFTLASAVLAVASLASAEPKAVPIHVQPIDSNSNAPPVPLAEVTYDNDTPEGSAAVTYYDAPELHPSVSLVRIGIYDSKANQWLGSTSVTSVENFGEGYAPHIVLSVDATNGDGEGEVLGASLRGVRIDAGQTRDFGPQAKVVTKIVGKQPELNKPIVLSPEGKNVEPEEKTFLQKYWWVLGIAAVLAMGGGGDK